MDYELEAIKIVQIEYWPNTGQWRIFTPSNGLGIGYFDTIEQAERRVAPLREDIEQAMRAAVEAEREACARIATDIAMDYQRRFEQVISEGDVNASAAEAASAVAAAIRARVSLP